MVAEYDYAGTMMTKRYAHWVGQPAPAEAGVPMVSYEGASLENATGRWLIADHQGSIIAAAHPSGATASINTYDEYGIPGPGNSGRFQYTGQIWMPELGMYYYKARIYSPTLARFLQTDPVGYDGGMNLYAYVGNDPINATDPSGTTCEVDYQRNGQPRGYRCKIDQVYLAAGQGLTPEIRRQVRRFNAEYTRVVNRLRSLPNARIAVGPSGRAPHNGAPLGAFSITRREAADNLIRRTFSYRVGDTGDGDRVAAYTPGTAGPSGTGSVTTYLTDRGLAEASARTVLHDGALHGSAQEYSGRLVLPSGSLLGEPPYRSGHQEPYGRASCQLLDEC